MPLFFSQSASTAAVAMANRVLQDVYFKQAKAQGFVARSAFKLLEIQEKHKIIPQGGRVVDLGCHPGAWLQVACKSLGPPKRGGVVVGVDIQETKKPPKYCDDRVMIVHADARILGPDFWQQHFPQGADAVLSDMCHWTRGFDDAVKSLELARVAWGVATGGEEAEGADPDVPLCRGVLRPGGSLVMKILQGQGTQEFAQELRRDFHKVAFVRPKATRSESKEVFLLGLKRK